jgi:methyltransferase (TIGR00027 family)
MSEPNPIRNVSDTALWVAIYRAMETERPDALFKDPYARRLGGERGAAIVRSMPSGMAMSWPLVVRTAVLDDIILRCIRDGAKTVLNLAAGLDARPFRLDLPASLRWIHVDMPEMVAYFRANMGNETPRCELEYVAADLREEAARREVFERAAAHGPVLVITEGLLVYLKPDEVADLARALHDQARAKWWTGDLASPLLLKYLEKQWAPKLREGNAPFQFGPRENTAFFAPFGWREREFHSTWQDALRLKRLPRHAWLWRILSVLQSRERKKGMERMSGIFLLQSNCPHP